MDNHREPLTFDMSPTSRRRTLKYYETQLATAGYVAASGQMACMRRCVSSIVSFVLGVGLVAITMLAIAGYITMRELENNVKDLSLSVATLEGKADSFYRPIHVLIDTCDATYDTSVRSARPFSLVVNDVRREEIRPYAGNVQSGAAQPNLYTVPVSGRLHSLRLEAPHSDAWCIRHVRMIDTGVEKEVVSKEIWLDNPCTDTYPVHSHCVRFIELCEPMEMEEFETSGNVLHAGDSIEMGKKYFSPNHKFYFIFQSDGNLVLYTAAADTICLWQAGMGGTYADRAHFSRENIIEIYDKTGRNVWKRGPKNRSSTLGSLFANDAGDLQIIVDGNVEWNSGTAGHVDPQCLSS